MQIKIYICLRYKLLHNQLLETFSLHATLPVANDRLRVVPFTFHSNTTQYHMPHPGGQEQFSSCTGNYEFKTKVG